MVGVVVKLGWGDVEHTWFLLKMHGFSGFLLGGELVYVVASTKMLVSFLKRTRD